MASKEIFRTHTLLSFLCLMLSMQPSCSQKDRLLPGQLMKDGDELVSDNGMFRLRFFSPQNREKVRYLGIFYTDIDRGNEPVVWVANRNIPISDNSGRLTIDTTDGNLKILHNGGNPIAVSSVRATGNTSATLLQTGNLVLHEIDPLDPLLYQWQSFDYPTDTLLPEMKLGIDFRSGKKWFLRSWVTPGSPAEGSFTLGMDPNTTNQLIIWREGEVYSTTGLWRNGSFGESLDHIFYYFSFISNKQIAYFSLPSFDDTKRQYLILNSDGSLTTERGYSYNPCSSRDDLSDNCVVKLPICRRSIPNFQMKPGFMSGVGFKFKESHNMTYLNCRNKCLNNCSCVAFATNNYTSCEIWSRGTKFTESSIGNFQQIYMEFAVLREEKERWLWTMFIMGVTGALLVLLLCSLWYQIRRKCKAGEEKWWISLSIVVGVALIMPLLCYLCYMLCRKFKAKVKSILDRKKLLRELRDTVSLPTTYGNDKMQANDPGMKHDLKIFDFQTIAAATDNFSNVNKLGEGGFGPVYKGTLLEGEKVAIKRLSRRSRQGMVEFKNEAKVIAKLQHNNLVRLLGCSLKGEERILVYEYMPNKSLDFFIFDSSRGNLLNWKKRFNIIEGIAQGLIYLHKYSRLRVIHRDLKASNILLDGQMNPKISDFGMAKIFGLNETEANTNRVVGTYGYMSPEYAMSGIVSMKTDVFSFGVLVLEIVSGKKNNSCYHSEHPLNLVGYAWQLWNEGKGLELKDPTLKESCSDNEVLRCLHVGLLCVQDRTKDRPTMSDVVSMLASETMLLPAPKQPAFFININSEEPQLPESNSRSCTINDVTISDMAAR